VLPAADPGAANLGILGSLAGTITAAPDFSDYIKTQLQTTGATPPGNVNQKTMTLEYDES
jgi:hypothetical protein